MKFKSEVHDLHVENTRRNKTNADGMEGRLRSSFFQSDAYIHPACRVSHRKIIAVN